jgi:putative ABC transport system substrate-binding protein
MLRFSEDAMRRREFISLLVGTSAAWPLTAAAQQAARLRHIGAIMPATATDAEFQSWFGAFLQRLGQLGWTIGQNIRIETRWATSDASEIRKQAAELVTKAPDVILAAGTSTVGPVLELTRTIPVVFPNVVDPVAAGFVESLARPGGNATGFLLYEYSLSGKWLELLRQSSPDVTRVAVLRDPTTPSGTGQLAFIQAAASSLKLEIDPINMRDADEIERGIAEFARTPNGGLILTGSGKAIALHGDIIALAARYKLPAVYYELFLQRPEA